MILATSPQPDTTDPIATLPPDLRDFARQAAHNGTTLDTFERGLLKRLLAMGQTTTDLFLNVRGNGDLGPTVETAERTILHRSEKPQARSIRTIFGRHGFHAFVYSRGPNQKIELRPIDTRLNLPDSRASYRLQEFTQLFCVEKAFGVGAKQFEAIFGQKLSVAVLEDINRDMGTQAETFLDEHLPEPKASEEGELLILTADGKGVPLVKADAERSTKRNVPAIVAWRRWGVSIRWIGSCERRSRSWRRCSATRRLSNRKKFVRSLFSSSIAAISHFRSRAKNRLAARCSRGVGWRARRRNATSRVGRSCV